MKEKPGRPPDPPEPEPLDLLPERIDSARFLEGDGELVVAVSYGGQRRKPGKNCGKELSKPDRDMVTDALEKAAITTGRERA